MTTRARSESGFTLIEMLVSVTIMLLVTGAVFQIMNPSQGMFQTQPEVADVQQRLRVGTDTLTHDLMMAGAGTYAGTLAGTLAGFFAPIQPSRQGNVAAYDDGPGVFKTDTITIFYVPTTSSQTTISQAMPNTSAELKVTPEPVCPGGANLCGFQEGMNVIIYDNTGSYDTFTITHVQDQAAHLQHNQQGDLSKKYDIGAKVVQIQTHIYFYDAAARQLKHYDGFQTVTPVLDNVVGVNFEYYGDPNPPVLKRPGTDQTVTYGPQPPALGVVQNGWPAGENCTIQMNGGQQVPRLAALGAPNGGLVPMTAANLTDGPWCPDATNNNRFDADLLRIRKIRVTLRVQTGVAALRGPLTNGPDAMFVNAGTSVDGYHRVPDQQIRFDISPRNMNLGR